MSLGTGSFWLESVALPIGILTLQALPLGVLLQLGAAWVTKDANQPLLPTWALLVMLLEAFYLARWLARGPAAIRWRWILISISALAMILIIWYLRLYSANGPIWQAAWLSALLRDFASVGPPIMPPIGVVALLAFLWWRGVRLGQTTLEHEQVARNFKVGFAVLITTLLLIGTVKPIARDVLAAQLGLTLPVFLFVGLSSLSLARLAEIQRGRRTQGVSQADPTRSWLIAMLVLSGVMVIVLLGIEQAFSYHTLLGVVSALTPVWDVISAVVGWIAVGLGFIIYWLLNPLVSAIQAAFNKISPPNQSSKPPSQPKPPLVGKGAASLPHEWLLVGQWVLIGIGVIIAVIIFMRILRRLAAWRHEEEGDEERENLGATGILGAQLRALLANLAGRFQRKPSAEADEETFPRYSVRALYRRVLRQAAALGLGRRATETPQEFAQRFGAAVAHLPHTASLSGTSTGVSDSDLEALTKAYEQVRYGDYDLPAEQVATLTADVDHLLQHLAQPPPR